MSKKIEILIKFLIYAIFFVPLVVLPSTFIFPFVVPKILWIRSLVELMTGAYIILLFINWKQYSPKFTWLNLVLLLYLLSFAVSTFAGVDYYHSLWDNYERMLGLFTVFHYIVFYFIATGILRDWIDWKWAGRVFLSAGFLVMFIAWLQTQNPDLLLNRGSDRVSSTLGNPIYVGGYGLFLTFLAILLARKEKNGLWQFFYGLCGLFGFMGIFWSGTRGDLLGLVLAAGCAVIAYIIVLKDYPKVRYSLVGLAVLGVVSVGLLYNFRQTDFVKNFPGVGRAVNTSFSDIKDSTRWIAWNIAWQSFKEKPFFGWGPNNYFYVFNSHYDPKSLDYGYSETWFDNAHNIIMNTLAVQGAFGLVTYVGVFIAAAYSLVIAYRKRKIDCHFMIIAGAFLVANFVNKITVFEDATSYLYLMFWLALINSMTNIGPAMAEENSSAVAIPDKKVGVGMMSTSLIVSFVIVFIFNIQNATANQKTLVAIRDVSSDINGDMSEVKDALAFNSPHIDDIRSDIANSVSSALSNDWQKMKKDKVNEVLKLTIDNLEKNLSLHPLDIRNQLSLAQLYQLQAMVNNNGTYLLKSENVLEDALSKSPKRQQIIYSLSGVKMQLNKLDEAAKLLEGAIQDNPKIAESYWRLGYVYKLEGKTEKVQEIYKLMNSNSVNFTSTDLDNISKVFGVTTSLKQK